MARRKIEIKIGDKFGDLTIIDVAGTSEHGDRLYKCKCVCGNICVRKATIIKSVHVRGYINSCGCRKTMKKQLTLSQL